MLKNQIFFKNMLHLHLTNNIFTSLNLKYKKIQNVNKNKLTKMWNLSHEAKNKLIRTLWVAKFISSSGSKQNNKN